MLHQRSEVDLAVLLGRMPRSLEAHAELLHDLQRLFPERQVDVALLNRADPLFLGSNPAAESDRRKGRLAFRFLTTAPVINSAKSLTRRLVDSSPVGYSCISRATFT